MNTPKIQFQEDKMDIDDFFEFDSKLVSTNFHAGAMGLFTNERYLQLIEGDYSRIDFPVCFLHTYGQKMTDLLDTGYPPLYLISDKLQTLLEANKLSGWKCFPIRLFDKRRNEIFGYHGFSITGRCGPIDDTKASIVEKSEFTNGPMRKFYKGLYIGLDQWDKTDFFITNGSLHVIITKKAANILKENKISNLIMVNLADIERRIYDH
jgi:hypothetical protein